MDRLDIDFEKPFQSRRRVSLPAVQMHEVSHSIKEVQLSRLLLVTRSPMMEIGCHGDVYAGFAGLALSGEWIRLEA